MKMPKMLLLSVLSVCFVCVNTRAAITTVYDHFDDGVLAPAWSVSLQNSTGWSYVESGTNLTVTDIIPTVINAGEGGSYATVILRQTFTPLLDFNVDFDFSWTSAGSMRAMQYVGIGLYDSVGNQVAAAAYYDAWVLWRGAKYAIAGGDSIYPAYNTLPFDGTASVDISRLGDSINVLWDGVSLISGTSSSPLSRVDLEFDYYAYNGVYGTSFFDSESIDLVRIQGNPIPAPGALLLGSIGMGLVNWLRRHRAL
jgi:hypothetical protein